VHTRGHATATSGSNSSAGCAPLPVAVGFDCHSFVPYVSTGMSKVWVAVGVLSVLLLVLVLQRQSQALSDTELAAKVMPGTIFPISCHVEEGVRLGKPYNRVCRSTEIGRDVAWLQVDGADYCVVEAVGGAEGRRC
jgi:hypothetical protein